VDASISGVLRTGDSSAVDFEIVPELGDVRADSLWAQPSIATIMTIVNRKFINTSQYRSGVCHGSDFRFGEPPESRFLLTQNRMVVADTNSDGKTAEIPRDASPRPPNHLLGIDRFAEVDAVFGAKNNVIENLLMGSHFVSPSGLECDALKVRWLTPAYATGKGCFALRAEE
jgi:hypothetical protein